MRGVGRWMRGRKVGEWGVAQENEAVNWRRQRQSDSDTKVSA